jgi:hypothetical protein
VIKGSFLVSFLFLLVLQCCKNNDDDPCAEENKENYFLSLENKQWFSFSQQTAFNYDDSIGNTRTFNATLNELGISHTCDYNKEYWTVVYSNDSCPFKFSFNISNTTNFNFTLTTGFNIFPFSHCESSFNTIPASADSIVFRGRVFYNVFKFEDGSRIVYFTKLDGIVAFTVDSILWVKIP